MQPHDQAPAKRPYNHRPAMRVCPGCGVEREAQADFALVGERRKSTCYRCDQREAATPKTCRRCGEHKLPAAYPRNKDGKTSAFCGACHDAPAPPRTCAKCGQAKPTTEYHRYKNNHWARSCTGCRRAEHGERLCSRCHRVLPADSYHRYRSGTLASSCNDCRRSRPNGPKGPVCGPNPCKVCGGKIIKDEPPSRLAARVTCSEACENAARRNKNRTCNRCKRVLPFDAFDRNLVGRNRRSACKECRADDSSVWRGDLVMRPTVAQLNRKLKVHANLRGLKYGLPMASVRRLHRQPCELCGNAMSCVVLREVEQGYIAANCRPVCRLCRRLLKLLSWTELLLHGNQIAIYSPLDPTRPADAQQKARIVADTEAARRAATSARRQIDLAATGPAPN